MSEKLVVSSKVKKLIKEKAGMNTAANAMDQLSIIVAKEIDQAIENAKRDRRKTVMDRDFR